jgi:hypothetical protein
VRRPAPFTRPAAPRVRLSWPRNQRKRNRDYEEDIQKALASGTIRAGEVRDAALACAAVGYRGLLRCGVCLCAEPTSAGLAPAVRWSSVPAYTMPSPFCAAGVSRFPTRRSAPRATGFRIASYQSCLREQRDVHSADTRRFQLLELADCRSSDSPESGPCRTPLKSAARIPPASFS